MPASNQRKEYTKALDESESDVSDLTWGATFGNGDNPLFSDGSIVRDADGNFQVGKFTVTKVGITISDDATRDEWISFYRVIDRLKRAVQWCIADWAAHGEKKYKETYEDLADITGYKISTLTEYAYVSKSVEKSIRIDNLSFAHHQKVAGLPKKQQQKWLSLAVDKKWSVKDMQTAMDYVKTNGQIGDTLEKRLVGVEKVLKLTRPTPLQKVERSATKLMLATRKNAHKSDDRAGWAEYARGVAEQWLQLADEIESGKELITSEQDDMDSED